MWAQLTRLNLLTTMDLRMDFPRYGTTIDRVVIGFEQDLTSLSLIGGMHARRLPYASFLWSGNAKACSKRCCLPVAEERECDIMSEEDILSWVSLHTQQLSHRKASLVREFPTPT